MKKLVLISLLANIIFSFYTSGQGNINLKLKEGDIVLQKIPCGDLCDAIIATTPCEQNRMFNHCGIVHYEKNMPYVIEAIGKEVKLSPLPDFLQRDNSPTLYVARLKPEYKSYIETGVKKAIVYIGAPYDDAFLPGSDSLYCSELVYNCFKKDSAPHLFPMEPMTFKSKNGKTFPAWSAYYKKLNMDVPEGKPGINPCAIANSQVVNLISIAK
ncbi:MAG TPA: YiiX/YebB-like N1pC/P60 family cysteine hydrolase [Flavipsychrobacter sp.]|nr:YiiX/YebB-like N1pC/P60 family cysteine hydrolase [Flavipsychrobacter sp.]